LFGKVSYFGEQGQPAAVVLVLVLSTDNADEDAAIQTTL
jgi:hypothetical protein